jgi:very-short-patch-repair endonuclease
MNKPSSYEAVVINILRAAAINFEREKHFKDLRNGYYRFDFYIPSLNILIECDGEGHFQYIKKFHKSKSDFTKAQERDRLKNSYALAQGIKLYRIPYWEFENVKNFDDLIQVKFLVTTKWWNDIIWKDYCSKNSKIID